MGRGAGEAKGRLGMQQLQFGEILAHTDLLLRGVGLTAALWAIAFSTGLSAGFFIGLLRTSNRRWLAWPARAFVEIFRNTPVLIQLIWFYYALPVLSGIQLPAFAAAALALSLNASAYCAEIYRGGIRSIAKGQFEAGRALGMGHARLMWRIILPQVMRRMLPAFTNRGVELAKNTSVASIVTVNELLYQARMLSSEYYLPLETFTIVAVIYFILIYPGTLAAYALERRLNAKGA